MIKIRYHHLMCIPRYRGEGYSVGFCENLQKIKDGLKDNNYVLVDSCDDVCRFCPNNNNGVCNAEEKVNRYDKLVKEKLERKEALLPEEICSDCCWFDICGKIQ